MPIGNGPDRESFQAKAGRGKKALSEAAIPDDEGIDEIRKADALIRGAFAVDPEILDDQAWARLLAQALYLERRNLKNQAELFSNLFGKH